MKKWKMRSRGRGGSARRGVDEICPRQALDLDWHMPRHFRKEEMPAHELLRPQELRRHLQKMARAHYSHSVWYCGRSVSGGQRAETIKQGLALA